MISTNSGSPEALRAYVRSRPLVEPHFSVRVALLRMADYPASLAPVCRDNRLCGLLDVRKALSQIALLSEGQREVRLTRSVEELMDPPSVVLGPDATPADAVRIMGETGQIELPVVDADGWLYGMVLLSDLALKRTEPHRPMRIGGMATPFGVYLTDGSRTGGVGSYALFASGLMLGALLSLSGWIVLGGVTLLERYAHLPRYAFLTADNLDAASSHPAAIAGTSVMFVISALVFLLLVRATPVAGYHAAEHQTVHAIEQGELLLPANVARMPRAHPRCGTNLMAASMLFTLFMSAAPMLDRASAGLVAALATAMTWRGFGAFLQNRFTTKPASPGQLASGIAAGESLLAACRTDALSRPGRMLRIWRSGLVQIAAGVAVISGLEGLLESLIK